MSGKTDPMRLISEGRSDLFSFDPEKLVIVTDPKHPLYDERAFGPVDEALVLNIMANGVLQPIIFRTEEKDGENIPVVIAGRQRVKAAREANKRLVLKGEPPRMVPGVRRKSNDHETIGFMVSENELRKNDDMLIKASKARRMMEEYGYSEDKCALMFGVSVATLRRYMAIDEATPEVRSAFVAGELPAGAAVELAKLQPGQQREAVKELKEKGKAGKKKHQGANKAAKETAKAKGAPPAKEREHLRSIKNVRALVEYLEGEVPHNADKVQHETLLVALKWVMGDGPEELTGILEAMQMELPKGADKLEPPPPIGGPFLLALLARLAETGRRSAKPLPRQKEETMRLSPATVILLGKLCATFQDKFSNGFRQNLPALVVSEGVILAHRYDGQLLTIVDKACSPEKAVHASGNILKAMAGLRGRVELVTLDDVTIMTPQGTELKFPGESDGPLLGFEGWEKNYEVSDLPSFMVALKETAEAASKDDRRPKLNAVHFSGGEAFGSDGHKLTVRYLGVDVEACLPLNLALSWIKMLASYKDSKGGWWIRQSQGRIALCFRHFGQEVTLAGNDIVEEEGQNANTFRKTLSRNNNVETPVVQVSPYVSAFVRLFDVVAIYANGEVVGWCKGETDNGSSGPIPRGKPLVVLQSEVAGKLLRTKKSFGPITMGFFGSSTEESVYGGCKLGEDLIMGCTFSVPQLPPDCYITEQAEAEVA